MSRAGKRILTEETGERIAEALEGLSAPVAIEDALAIVCNGNTAPANIASGKYLFIKNHSTLPAGGYHSIAAISAGDTLDLSNVEPDEDGIANSLSEQIGKYNVALPNDTTSANFKAFVTGVCTAFNALNVSSVPYLVYAKWVTHSWYLFNMVKDGNNVAFSYSCADSGGFGRYVPSTSTLTVYEVTATAL